MSEFTAIKTQAELDNVLSDYDWHDAFIREVHLLSPTYIIKDDLSTVAPDAAIAARVLICTPNLQYPGIEFLFEKVEAFYVPSQVVLRPTGNCSSKVCSLGAIEFRFFGSEGPAIRAKKLRYRLLDESCWGYDTTYACENIFDEGGFLNI